MKNQREKRPASRGWAGSLPSILEVESCTRCNIQPPCVMCYPRIFDKRGFYGDIADEAVKKIMPYLRGFRTISLHGVGEPLLGKKLVSLLDNMDPDKTWIQFDSNGLLLNEEMCRILISKKLSGSHTDIEM